MSSFDESRIDGHFVIAVDGQTAILPDGGFRLEVGRSEFARFAFALRSRIVKCLTVIAHFISSSQRHLLSDGSKGRSFVLLRLS